MKTSTSNNAMTFKDINLQGNNKDLPGSKCHEKIRESLSSFMLCKLLEFNISLVVFYSSKIPTVGFNQVNDEQPLYYKIKLSHFFSIHTKGKKSSNLFLMAHVIF